MQVHSDDEYVTIAVHITAALACLVDVDIKSRT